MVTKLINGDYVPDMWGGLETAEGPEELLQRILYKLTARRGAFPLMPELGSRLHLLWREKPGERSSAAAQYIKEALSDETELELKSVEVSEKEENLMLEIKFGYMGDDLSVDITV